MGAHHASLALEEALAQELALFWELVDVVLEALLRGAGRVGAQDAVGAENAVGEGLAHALAAHGGGGGRVNGCVRVRVTADWLAS